MLAVIKSIPKEHHISIQNVKIPEVREGWVLVKVDIAGVCGSDVHVYKWTPDYQVRYKGCLPVVLGHEYTGVVEDIGENVKKINIGDRVVSRTPISCDHCYACLSGQEAICEHRKLLGVHYNGAMAEYVAVPANNCHVLPRQYPIRLAALSEPISIAFGAVYKAERLLGKNVAIIGPGPIGYLIALLCKLSGASLIFILGLPRDKNRFEIFQQSIENVHVETDLAELKRNIGDTTFTRRADVVFEASGAPQALQTALELVRKQGLVVQVGIVSKLAEVNTNLAVRDEIVIKGTPAIPKRLWIRTLDFLSQLPDLEKEKFEKVISHFFPLEKAEEAFLKMSSGEGMKMMLSP